MGSSVEGIPLENTNFDLEKTLRDLAHRCDEAGIQSRELGVAFEKLRVVVKGSSASYQPSLVSMFNPLTVLESIQNVRHAQTREILSGFEGTVKPGEMLLVVGRPGAGCSSFLKTLANQRGDYHAVHGDVYYDSLSPADVRKHHRGDVIYCPEDDVHFPTLTVEQTIKFAAKLRTPRLRLGYSREQYAEAVTDMLTTVFGLKHARKTLVGDAAIRGVSGGEKKRVSIAEVLALRARLACWDNPTRGLDSSTALEFVQALRTATDLARMTTVVSLYQAGESLYNLFDKVCVLYEGKMVYYGPAREARSYFISLGYEPANRQTSADFLVAVTDPNGRIPRSDVLSLPRTAEEFAAYFAKSDVAKANRADIAQFKEDRVGKNEMAHQYQESAWAEYSQYASKDSPFMTSLGMQSRAVILRRLQILRGNMLATFMYIFSFAFQGTITGAIFLKMSVNTDTFFSRGGVLFFSLLNQAVISMSEVPSLFGQRPIVQRQSSWAMYRPSIDQVALTLVDLPVTFVSTAIFGILIYEMAQLQQSADQFFIFFLFCFIQAVVTKTWFRALTALMPDPVLAQALAGLSTLTYVVYTGYSIPPPSMVKALKWVSYLNPLRWGFEALMSNEFRTVNGACGNLVPQGPGYENITLVNQVCTTVGAQPGQSLISGTTFIDLSFNFSFSHTWRNFGIIVAFGVAFFAALLIFTEISTRLLTSHDIVLFKRSASSSCSLIAPSPDDVERGSQLTAMEPEIKKEKTNTVAKKAVLETSSTTDVFSWHHLTYTVPTDDGPKRLLHDVSGYVAPGKLTALMGESGAGKTTLLNALAQRVDVGVIAGDRFVNGQTLPKDFQSQTAYCQQQDTHVGSATVYEALLFSAQLRQPASIPVSEKMAYVEICIELCGLEPYRNAAVGSLGIENRKRTTIGVELAAKPRLLLFLDEPTSGLDSQSAWNIVLFLRDLANKGQAILCTIHQPSAELFQMFDRLLLLRKGGETVYFGYLGHNATTVLQYFQRNGGRSCEPEENPAEYMLDVIGAGATAHATQDWHELWSHSEEARRVQNELEDIHVTGRKRSHDLPSSSSVEYTSEYATSWFHQVGQLAKRSLSAHNRDPSYLLSKFALNATAGLFVGLSFFSSDNSQQGTQNKLFAVFMASITSVPLATQVQLPYFDARSVYEIRERPSRMYHWTALVTSQILVEIPWGIVASSFFYFCWYWTIGFPSDRAGYTWLMLCVLFPMYYTTVGQTAAAMCPDPQIAALVFGSMFSFVLSFNGVVQPYSQLGWWQWVYRITPFTYFIEGLLGQALGEQSITCSALEVVTVTPPSGKTCTEYMEQYISIAGGYLTNPDASSDCGFCSTRSTDEFLGKQFNIFYSNRWRDVGVMAAFVAFNIVATFAFMWFFRIRKGSFIDMFRGKRTPT